LLVGSGGVELAGHAQEWDAALRRDGAGLKLRKAPFSGVRMSYPPTVVPGIVLSDRYYPKGAGCRDMAVASTLADLATFRRARRC